MVFFHHLEALPVRSLAAFLPARRFSSGFWQFGWCANLSENVVHALANPTWRQFLLLFLPGERFVHTQGTSEPELPGNQRHQVAPAFSLLRCAEHGQSPIQALFGKAIPMVDRIATHVDLPPGA